VNKLLKPGTILLNTYKILGVIDQGGMGAIYKAESRLLAGEEYAVKEMLDNYSSAKEKQEGLDSFQQESDILKKLRHPNLPRVHAFFEENSRYYLAMDFIKGRTLENIVESTSDFIPESVVLRWSTDLCNILEYLHNQKPPIIFRDLNPRNIMLEEGTGDIKLIDFGIARFFKAGQSSDTLSLGSPGYCPIEQYGRGQTDIRSDVYTLGATLYHLLTKRIPVAAIERIKPTPLALKPPGKINPRISPHVEQTILQSMEINPDSRYQTIGEMRQALFTKSKTKKISQKTQKIRTSRVSDTEKQTQAQKKSTGSTTGSQTGRQTGSTKPRSNRWVWIVVLLLTSILGAQWLEGWQERASGRNATPEGATVLAIPGSVSERVSFLNGDRTDWWSFAIASPGTLTVTAILRNREDDLRLTLYDRRGRTILQQGQKDNARIDAVFIAEKPMTALAQVMAPRLWDEAAYTLHSGFAGPEGRLMASLIDLDGINAIVSDAVANLTGVTLPHQTVQNYAHPDSAPLLPLNTVINSQLIIEEGEGVTWWRADMPETGTLKLNIGDANSRKRPVLEIYNAGRELLPDLSKRRGEQMIAVQGDMSYFIKIHVDNYWDMMTYRLTTEFEADPDVLSGSDRSPAGAGKLSFQVVVHDTVSYAAGDRTDWWRITPPGSGVLTITLVEREPAATILMELYDQAGIVRLDEARTVEAGRSELSLELDGRETYLIKVFADTEEDASAYLVMSW
jgi:serine/threonine protein kinase